MRIGVTYGMRGYFAVMYDNEGPVSSGVGSFNTEQEARREAIDWAIAENLPTLFTMTPEEVDYRYSVLATKYNL